MTAPSLAGQKAVEEMLEELMRCLNDAKTFLDATFSRNEKGILKVLLDLGDEIWAKRKEPSGLEAVEVQWQRKQELEMRNLSKILTSVGFGGWSGRDSCEAVAAGGGEVGDEAGGGDGSRGVLIAGWRFCQGQISGFCYGDVSRGFHAEYWCNENLNGVDPKMKFIYKRRKLQVG
ncbi:unnamed protein product [Dovyalis caffra]|uniref:Uncharacterized protein n=1 Tax=Dovyalis caffra TaxID=77055 RepID=A0AAV1R030_9ROSI|nr:unnamed protein product [Dovyalis caffra]